MTVEDALRQRVEAWIREDPDPRTRQELEDLLAAGAEADLQDRFQGLLQFGTAGLRGLLGGGPHRMNRAVVIRATAGLCTYLKRMVPNATERGVAIGFDGRRMSRQFAQDAAEVVAGFGLRAHVFDDVVPTPLLAYASLRVNAAAGIMITASHNPPAYNGYKVYWGNGAQIIPPHDEGIAACIASLGSLESIPRVPLGQSACVQPLSAEIRTEYLAKIKALALHPETPRDLRVVYTAMHGVGGALVLDTLSDAGFHDVSVVAEQQDPDGEFPTVAFPNPEEEGAMDRALALAKQRSAELVLANDPDADRLAAIVRHDSTYRRLSGNELGCLLAHYLLDQGPKSDKRLVLCSVVSSPMLLSIGRAHGARAEQTLTGHKWIHNRAIELEKDGYTFVMGFEEALGYAVSSFVRDKDGISAAAVLCDMAAWCKSQGRTLVDELELAWRRYGMFLSEQVSIVLPGTEGAQRIASLMQRARRDSPTTLGAAPVVAVQDFATGTRRTTDGHESTLTFPRADVVVYELEGGHRAMLRPSGTEPKIKYYVDVRVEVTDDEPIAAAMERGRQALEAIVADFRTRLAP